MTAIIEYGNPGPASNDSAPKCMIVVPCYNEEKRLDTAAFLNYAAENDKVGFVFVDDGSKDGTFNKLIEMRMQNPRQIEVCQLLRNSGKAEAVRAGLRRALELQADITGYWDADLATPLSAIGDFHRLASRRRDIDVILGSRLQLLGHRINRKFLRLVISKICAVMARAAVKLPVTDTQCGAKMFRVTPALADAVLSPFAAGWLFDVELLQRLSGHAAQNKDAFYEYPLSEWEEVAGSTVTGRAVLRAGLAMLKLIFQPDHGKKDTPDPQASVVNYLVPANMNLEDFKTKSRREAA